jgi:arsenate reductase-like glutaredoxin family protein
MAKTIDWYYHRKGCKTCGRADQFLAKAGASVAEQVDARKQRLGAAEAVRLARTAEELWVAKGKRVVHLNLKTQRPSDDELSALLLGPTGNLRAPTMRRGRKLFVGFEPAALAGALLS